MALRIGELGHLGDARRAAMGSTLIERGMETGSLVIRKLGRDRAGELAIHRNCPGSPVGLKRRGCWRGERSGLR